MRELVLANLEWQGKMYESQPHFSCAGTVADDAMTQMPYFVTVTADDGNGQTASRTFTVIVNAPSLTATASSFNAVEGNDSGSVTVASFTTPDLNSAAGDFTATINYGDGTTDVGDVSGGNGSFTVIGDHTYAVVGNYPVSVLLTNDVTGASTTISTTATVADAAMTLTGGLRLGDPLTYQAGTFELGVLTTSDAVYAAGARAEKMISRSEAGSFSRMVPFSTCGKTPSAHNQRRIAVKASENVTVCLPGQAMQPERFDSGKAAYTTATTVYRPNKHGANRNTVAWHQPRVLSRPK